MSRLDSVEYGLQKWTGNGLEVACTQFTKNTYVLCLDFLYLEGMDLELHTY